MQSGNTFDNRNSYLYGIVLCVLIGLASIPIAKYIPLGAVSIAIILGMILGNTTRLTEKFKKGIAFSEGSILSIAVALMGVNLNFQILRELGWKSLLLIVSGLILTLLASLVLAKLLHFDKKFALLLGIGSGVCGSSAIAATEQIIGADEEVVGLSIAIVNFLGTIGIFLLPFIAKSLLLFSDLNAGIFLGNTLQAVGQVVAAGFSVSDSAGHIATLVKMARILLLFPLVMILIFLCSSDSRGKRPSIQKRTKIKIPKFIVGFILFSLLPTFNLLPSEEIRMIASISHYFLVIAMAAIGLKITLHSILKNAKFSLFVGGMIFLIQIVFSSVMINILF